MWLFVPHLGLGFCLPVLQWRGRGFTNLSQPFFLTPSRNGSVFVGVVHSTKWRRRNTGSQCYLCWSLCFSISTGRYDKRGGWQVTPLEIFLCSSQVLSKVQFDLTAATLCNRWFMITLALVTSLTLLLWLVLSPDMFPLLLMVFQIIKLVFCTFVMTEISLPLKIQCYYLFIHFFSSHSKALFIVRWNSHLTTNISGSPISLWWGELVTSRWHHRVFQPDVGGVLAVMVLAAVGQQQPCEERGAREIQRQWESDSDQLWWWVGSLVLSTRKVSATMLVPVWVNFSGH